MSLPSCTCKLGQQSIDPDAQQSFLLDRLAGLLNLMSGIDLMCLEKELPMCSVGQKTFLSIVVKDTALRNGAMRMLFPISVAAVAACISIRLTQQSARAIRSIFLSSGRCFQPGLTCPEVGVLTDIAALSAPQRYADARSTITDSNKLLVFTSVVRDVVHQRTAWELSNSSKVGRFQRSTSGFPMKRHQTTKM